MADQDEPQEDDADAQPSGRSRAWQNVVTGKDAVLLESMLKFYDQFAEQNQADVQLQKETARAYRRVGDIHRRLGQYDKAETAYRRALAAYHALAKASPDSASFSPPSPPWTTNWGWCYRDTGRLGVKSDQQKVTAMNMYHSRVGSSNEQEYAKKVCKHTGLDFVGVDMMEDLPFSLALNFPSKPNKPQPNLLSSHSFIMKLLNSNPPSLFMTGHGGDHIFMCPPSQGSFGRLHHR